jgi:hypothetical protein
VPRLSSADRLRFRRVFVVSLLALLLEIALGVVVWRAEQWHLLVLAAAFTTLLIATTMGLLLAGERWKLLGDFGQQHPLIMVSLIMGTVAALVATFAAGPQFFFVGPLALGFIILLDWAVHKVRDFLRV